jgi:hypothetical protein
MKPFSMKKTQPKNKKLKNKDIKKHNISLAKRCYVQSMKRDTEVIEN